MRVNCLAQEHNTMSPARARIRTTGVELANHEATAPLTQKGIDIQCMCEVKSQSVRANNNFSEECDLRLVFTSDGVVAGVAIRRVERYDLVKIQPTESETEH